MQIINDPNTHEEELLLATDVMYKLSLCNGDLTVDLVEMKAIPALMHICKTSKVVSVLENAIGALGGIAAKSVDNRNLVISAGVVNVILGLFKAHEKNLAFLKTCVWAASNLPRGGGNWPNDLLRLAPVVTKFLKCSDQDVVADSLWTLVFLSDGPLHRQQKLIAVKQLVPSVVHFLSQPEDLHSLMPALKVVGNLLASDDEIMDALLNEKLLDYMPPLLKHRRRGIRKEACWCLSNVFSGHSSQIRSAITAGILEPLLEIIHENFDSEIVKEALWCIANMMAGCEIYDFPLIIDKPHLASIIKIMISHNDANLPRMAIAGTLRMFQWFEENLPDQPNPFIDAIADLSEIIQNHAPTNPDAVTLYERYLTGPSHPSHDGGADWH